MRVIAKLDVKPPYVVKPVHFEGLRKIGEPAELARRYYEQGADEILYVDIVASLYCREILFDQIRSASEHVFVPFAAGGGIRSIEDISRLFHCGADKVALNTEAVQRDPDIIDQAARMFGSQAVMLNVEAKHWGASWECYTDCGRERSGRDVIEWVREAQQRGAGEILVQSVDRDGRRRGFDVELIEQVKTAVSVPIIAASGAGSLEDIVRMAERARPDAVAVSSVLHYGVCSISDIKTALKGMG
ncbi:MAG: imidazole glycerol phosphate synthase cyclase subunit [Gammaproteobacteria bacterium]|jgi:imidazole glycerol-phosphate synthase subunit HisF|nr:imidazole glycerol phosphate synthase cyclase subunit [Gammaproteobacteria bacterium]MBU0769876.1 imidazole glycerol phosphate synthase cyclase subunit [Gammaproteobacteria bacterium]MBU0854681.1 imidazole glycerol phosphate synthase cyclase subunit [Gammaproteobacteria bacterium]MBU1845446.1 imidazole glycerol phosphate synthase cyclase subunit [Gammaproteobacteria bacterium]